MATNRLEPAIGDGTPTMACTSAAIVGVEGPERTSMKLGISRSEGETWRRAAERQAIKWGVEDDVLGTYDALSPADDDNVDAAWAACREWDVLEPRPGSQPS